MDIKDIPQDVWFPVFTLVLGAFGMYLRDVTADSRRNKREIQARGEARADAIRARQCQYQRETLLALQEAIYEQIRFAGRIHVADAVSEHEAGDWGKNPLPPDVNDGFRLATATIQKLRVRVDASGIRDQSTVFVQRCIAVSMARSRVESDSAMERMSEISQQLNEAIGDRLRDLDQTEEASGR